jgi:putative RecB family exonuclease
VSASGRVAGTVAGMEDLDAAHPAPAGEDLVSVPASPALPDAPSHPVEAAPEPVEVEVQTKTSTAKTAKKSTAKKSTAKKSTAKTSSAKKAAAPRSVPVEVLDTADFVSRLPARLSPSRLSDFMQCPKLFYFKTLLGLKDPATTHTAVGSLAHHAMEKVFDHPRPERTIDRALSYVRPHWDEVMSLEAAYEGLVADGKGDEIVATAESMVRAWFGVEDPTGFDPEGRELYVKAQAAGIEVHGFIDRLDKVVAADGSVKWMVSDYKTGKVPAARFQDKAFFAMNVYALLLHKQLGITVDRLRLIYVRNGSRDDVLRQPVTEASLVSTERKLAAIWSSISKSARSGCFEATTSVLCQWCHFQPECPAWAPELDGVPILDSAGRESPR